MREVEQRTNTILFKMLRWIFFLFFILAARLFYLQVLEHHSFFTLGKQNFLRSETIISPRGNILDCNGNLLATNRPIANIYWNGTGNQKLSDKQRAKIRVVESFLDKEILNDDSKKILSRTEKSSTQWCIAHDVQLNQLSKILEQLPDDENITIKTHFKRYYPNKTLACHVLGHISQIDVDMIGKMGLEKILHRDLMGTHGKVITTINSLGTKLDQREIQQALAGQNIVTTVDLTLQKIAEDAFDSEFSGCLILIDPKNGALRSLLSRPHFDPSIFLNPIATPEWQGMQEGRPFINRAFQAAYPPASIFKLVTISAALEHNLIGPQDMVYCKGYVPFKGRNYHCARRWGHGELSLKESVAKSCNAIFYEIGTQMPIDDLATYAFKFGLGQITQHTFAEHEGLVPTSEWKLQTKGERWWQGETLSATIGQSYFLATPIQIACMIGSIFTGYLVKPRILEQEPVEKKPLEIKPETRAFLKKSMKLVVKLGTGKYLNKLQDVKIYAKTGTAQVSGFEKRNLGPHHKEHAYFVGTFCFKNTDPLTLVIFVEHAESSRIATNIAKKFLSKYRSYMLKKELNS